ncbi:TAP-like protein-domain-containing protein [Massariosphaeria phaeospora]|uniref:TAP-like protein-domain-containing protein n=1 Tax=Massariosphaeria phaeospora TaxID=100035 RepID=A0A7C8I928_9PLEO|nr:TAP-like protein-domain-containing protein [Massariosphaeria phaeospora]
MNGLPDLIQALGTQNNIISFDPRGVNNSGPDLSCFPGKDNTALLYPQDYGMPVDINSTRSLAETWARADAFGQWCSKVHGDSNSTSQAKYANTVATATDMLRYTEVLAASKGETAKESKLLYYGVSYGTVLGSTFAALFPNRIERMILDGVVDVEDYYLGKWESNLPDTDAAISSFFKYCFEGGEEACGFWSKSPEAIETRFHAVLDNLRDNPIIVVGDVDFPVIVTYSHFQLLLANVPYAPSALFPLLASTLTSLEQGNGALLASYLSLGQRVDECAIDPLTAPVGDLEPRQFIACTDGNGRFNLSTFDSFVAHVDLLVDQSHYLGETWAAGTSVNCRSLNIRAPESQIFTGTPSADSTSNPILFIGNTLDPVTPLRAAEKMSKLFGGARLLTQNSVGHGFMSADSSCTMGYVQQYLKDASLPDEGTVCESEEVPFKNASDRAEAKAASILKKRSHV